MQDSARASGSGPLACFLAEHFLPRCPPDDLLAHVDEHRRAVAGTTVTLLQTIHVPDDETCFALLRSPTAEAVQEVSDLFRLRYQRVLPAVVFTSGSEHVRNIDLTTGERPR